MKKLILLFLVVIGTTTVNAQLNNIAKLPTTTSVDTSHLIALGYTDTLGKRHAYGASLEKIFKAANDSGLVKTIYNADDTLSGDRTVELNGNSLIVTTGEVSGSGINLSRAAIVLSSIDTTAGDNSAYSQVTTTDTTTRAELVSFFDGGAQLGRVTITTDATESILSLLASKYLITLGTAPSSATDTGTAGEIRIDASFIYVCIATDTWVRSALVTWP